MSPTRSIVLAGLIAALLVTAFFFIGPEGRFIDYVVLQAQRSTTIALLALAAAILISCGQIDLSSAACLNLFGIATIAICNSWDGLAPTYSGVILSAVLAAVLFWAYGFVLSRFARVSSLMVTLAVSLVVTGLNHFILNALQGTGPLAPLINPQRTDRFESLGPDQLGALLPSPLLHCIGALLVLITALAWRFSTVRALHHLSLGESARASQRVGVDRGRVLRFAFGAAGVLVFMAWMNEFFAVRQGSWNIDSARGYELLAISAAVIGGSRIQGGRLDPLAVFLSAVFVQLSLGITHLTSMPSEVSYFSTGLALAGASYIDGRRSKMDAYG